LRAFEALREIVPARLTLVGADPSDIDNLVMDDRGIEALGKVDDETKDAVLARAHVLAAPSLGGESFGMVLTEAFACATPVVASDIPGYRDVMTAETGVLVPPDDPRALALAIASLLADEPRRLKLGAGARRRARAYSWDDIGRRLVAIYELVTGQSPATLAAAG
jgi:phosphatidylinositol alpha-mannosyltransferase